jgi:hypothetical protein
VKKKFFALARIPTIDRLVKNKIPAEMAQEVLKTPTFKVQYLWP